MKYEKTLKALIERYPMLGDAEGVIASVIELIKNSYLGGGRLYLCGNGGSSADCDHIVGELMKSFKLPRRIDEDFAEKLAAEGEAGRELAPMLERGLPAISLCEHNALSTAFDNDKNGAMTYAQQLSVLGRAGDVLITLSTSGNAKNCVYAATVAKAMGISTVAITGAKGGKLGEMADICVRLPETETYLVQELTLPVYHCLCASLEEEFFS